MISLECLLATVGILERSDVIRAFPKRFTSSCNFARSGKGLTGKSFNLVQMFKNASFGDYIDWNERKKMHNPKGWMKKVLACLMI